MRLFEFYFSSFSGININEDLEVDALHIQIEPDINSLLIGEVDHDEALVVAKINHNVDTGNSVDKLVLNEDPLQDDLVSKW